MSKKIRLMKYFVTDGITKARVAYSHMILANGRECVGLYAKDYSDNLGKIFTHEYQNDTDIQTDYFEKGSVYIYTDNPLYTKALERVRNH